MPAYGWFLATAAAVAASAALVWFRLARRGRRQTKEELHREALRAARSIRRSSPRPNRDVFDRGHGVPDRHSGAIAENSALGDAAGGGGGGGD